MIVVACKGSKEKNASLVLSDVSLNDSLFILDLDTAECRKLIRMSEVFDKSNLIPLETNKESLIGRSNQLLVKSDTLFILDAVVTKKLQMFHRTGKYIGMVGAIGNGPGEYVSPTDFGIDGNLLYVFDFDSQRINYYFLPTMEFSHSLRLNGSTISRYIAILDGKIYTDAYGRKNQNTYLLQEIDSLTGKICNKWMSVNKYNSGYLDLIFSGEGLFYKSYNKEIRYRQMFMNSIMQIKSGEISCYMNIKSNSFVTKELLTSLRNQKDWNPSNSLMSLEVIRNVHHYVEWGDYVQFSFDIKNFVHTIFYNKKTKHFSLTERMYDDLTFTEEQHGMGVCPIPLWGDADGQYSYISPRDMERLIELLKEGKINKSVREIGALQNLFIDANPILIYYEKK